MYRSSMCGSPTPPPTTRSVGKLKPHSLVINATGLGKDAPGSPALPMHPPFPVRAVVWELNYRGDLVFLDQARRQQAAGKLQIEDGWTHFIHGWTQVIAESLPHRHLPSAAPGFDVHPRASPPDTARNG